MLPLTTEWMVDWDNRYLLINNRMAGNDKSLFFYVTTNHSHCTEMPQQTFNCSNSIIQTQEKGVKYVQS